MIKLFRNIRQNLLNEGKTTRYLKYAIGEIVLVVIGILIALSVNNLNQSEIDKRNELTYLKGIYDDLNTQIAVFEETMQLNAHYISTVNDILNDYTKNSGFKANDTLLSQLNTILSTSAPIEIKTSFTELLYSGEISLVHNDTLRKNLVRFYQDLERMVKISMTNVENIYQTQIYPIIYNRTLMVTPGKYSNLESDLSDYYEKRTYPERTKALVYKKIEDKDSEVLFVNALNIKLVVESLQLERSKTIIDKAQKLKKEIEKETKQRHHLDL